MLNTIGMSESILKLIERRSKTDIIIFCGMALFTLLLIFTLFYYVKPMLFGTAIVATNEL
jgi:hypothetical protein